MFKLGITIGDINGIGPEVIVKALAKHYIPEDCHIFLFGIESIIDDLAKKLQLVIKIPVNPIEPEIYFDSVEIEYGKPTILSGEISYKSLELAVNYAIDKKIDGIITSPISKEALHLAGYNYSGHTEVLQAIFPDSNAQMLFVSDFTKMLLLTRHVPLREVPEIVTRDLIVKNVFALEENLRKDFAIVYPRIAILALNPHAGESTIIGSEEEKIIIPAIEYLKTQNINISGPFPSDSFWLQTGEYDCIIALYHDQGLIPMKILGRENLVNVTCGLPLVRTSPCHGTAFDIAGKFIANEMSLVSAIDMARQITIFREAMNSL